MWWGLFAYWNKIYKFDVWDCLQNKTKKNQQTKTTKKKNTCFDCPKGQFSLRTGEHSRRKGQILALPPQVDFLPFSLPGHALLPSHSTSIPCPVWHPAKDLEVNLFFDGCNAIEVWRFYGISALPEEKKEWAVSGWVKILCIWGRSNEMQRCLMFRRRLTCKTLLRSGEVF